MSNYLGESAALLTAIFWTITAVAFEKATLKMGSLTLNVVRLFIGLFFLSVYVWIRRGNPLPFDASGHEWIWLMASGFVGFVFGDLFLFKSYTIIGSRFAMLIMTLAPPIAALGGWMALGEKLTPLNILGMAITIFGISLAIFNKKRGEKGIGLKLSFTGILFAFFGAAGQGIGLVLSKYGMGDYDPFAATQIRLIAGIIGFLVLILVTGKLNRVITSVKKKEGMAAAALGSFFGPFLGVSFSLLAVKYTETGIAATIMAIVPVLIIPPAILIYKEKITFMEFAGSIISIGGVALLFLT